MKRIIRASRYHDFSAGHRVYGHESKCAHLHGHNYRVHFHVEAPALDGIGRVLDFSVIKTDLCQWVEDNWDHKFLLWEGDPLVLELKSLDPEGVRLTRFNPTAENMAQYLLTDLGKRFEIKHAAQGIQLVRVVMEETRKCSAEVFKA